MHRRSTSASASLAVSSVALLLTIATGTGCGNSSGNAATGTSGDGSTPSSPASVSVAAISPASGATQVATNAPIQITFTSAATVNTTDIKLTDPNAVAGAVTFDASTNTATFTPTAALPASATVTVTVSGVTSSGGTALATFTSTFTTAAPASSTVQYQVALYPVYNPNPTGQITIGTNGNVTVQFTGGTANTTLTVQFCPGFNQGITQPTPACINVGTVTTDGSGNADTTVKFPQAGQWVGDFQLNSASSSTTPAYTTGSVGSGQSQTFLATLEPESTVNGGTLTRQTPQGPLTSGSVSYTNSALQFTVAGATPNTTYDILQSETRYMDSSGTYDIGQLTTDGSGNGHLTLTTDRRLGWRPVRSGSPYGNRRRFRGRISGSSVTTLATMVTRA